MHITTFVHCNARSARASWLRPLRGAGLVYTDASPGFAGRAGVHAPDSFMAGGDLPTGDALCGEGW